MFPEKPTKSRSPGSAHDYQTSDTAEAPAIRTDRAPDTDFEPDLDTRQVAELLNFSNKTIRRMI